MIHIRDEKRHRRAREIGRPDHPAQRGLKRAQVVEAGQIVGRCEMMQPAIVAGELRRHDADREEQRHLHGIRLAVVPGQQVRIRDVVQNHGRQRGDDSAAHREPGAGKNDRQIVEMLDAGPVRPAVDQEDRRECEGDRRSSHRGRRL